jgi:hypothetical protein
MNRGNSGLAAEQILGLASRMNTRGAYYLRLTLMEEDAARNSTSAEARKRHEELAVAYEMRCLLGAHSSSKQVEPAS